VYPPHSSILVAAPSKPKAKESMRGVRSGKSSGTQQLGSKDSNKNNGGASGKPSKAKKNLAVGSSAATSSMGVRKSNSKNGSKHQRDSRTTAKGKGKAAEVMAGRKLYYDAVSSDANKVAVHNFYGKALPRPYVMFKGTDKQKRSFGVLNAVLAWAEQTPFNMGGLDDKRTRFVGVMSKRFRKNPVVRAKSALALYAESLNVTPAEAKEKFEALTEDERKPFEVKAASARANATKARKEWRKQHPSFNDAADKLDKSVARKLKDDVPPPPPPPLAEEEHEDDEEDDDLLANLSESESDGEYIPKRLAKKPRLAKKSAAAQPRTPRRTRASASQPSEAATPSAFKDARFNAFEPDFSPASSPESKGTVNAPARTSNKRRRR